LRLGILLGADQREQDELQEEEVSDGKEVHHGLFLVVAQA